MRFFLKIVLLAALPIGGYWLCKKWEQPTEIDEQPTPAEDNKGTAQSTPGRGAEERGGVGSVDQIIDRLSNIDGVTSRVAENLVGMGIKSKEALMELTEEELRAVKGIGPKRAKKILNME